MAHTEGPWETVGATRVWCTGKHGGAVAIVAEPECENSGDFNEVEMRSKRWDEAMANARLIAAAPELLATLIAAPEPESEPHALCRQYLEWHTLALAAIAKAAKN